ncbi:MAG TPA: tetratricopeptide repeat protein [Pirellulales bacterium]|jgi:tetratricopeptide (TPR) repeat protein|nr:tetratricopeptide repeat protein [Pirellulales bacterium]
MALFSRDPQPLSAPGERAPLSLKRAGGNVASQLALAHALLNDGQIEPALAALEQALAENPESSEAQLLTGIALTQNQQFAEAIGPLRRAIQLDPESSLAYTTLTSALMKIKDYRAALEAIERLLRQTRAEALPHALRAEALWKLQRAPEAIASFRLAIAQEPELAWIHERLGRLFIEQEQWLDALAELRTAVRLAPAAVDAVLALGDVLRHLGRGPEALQCYTQATFCNQLASLPYLRLGQCSLEQGHLLDALVWLRTSLTLEPGQPECFLALAELYALGGRAQVAERYRAAAAAVQQLSAPASNALLAGS